MIVAIGVDIVEINEIKSSITKSKRFIERVFTENEKNYCESKENKYQHYAARFAVKEAVMKALGTGWDNEVQWKQIEVIHGGRKLETGIMSMPNTQCLMPNINNGKPEIMLNGKARKLAQELNVDKIHVSLSHSINNATAMVILEGYTDAEIRF